MYSREQVEGGGVKGAEWKEEGKESSGTNLTAPFSRDDDQKIDVGTIE